MTDIKGITRISGFIKKAKYLAPLFLLAFAIPSPAAVIIWSGASGTDTNWSNGANWGGTAPGGGDDAKFFNAGTNAAAGVPTSQVDTSFAGWLGSLQYGSTNGYHTTYITNGQTLNITNVGGLVVGTPTDIGVAYTNRATITGSGGALSVNNTNANISLAQGTATSVNFAQSILDLSGLGNFTANVNRIGIGTTTTANPGNANQRDAGTLILAMTNFITANYVMPVNSYLYAASTTNAIELQRNAGNNGGSTTPCTLFLGITNVLNIDSIGCGRDKSDLGCLGRVMFNPAILVNNPVANIYGAGGSGTRVTWFSIGDGGSAASGSHGGVGTNDFTGGTINIFANFMSLGRDCSATTAWAGPNKGTLTFTAGTIDVNNLILGNQSLLLTGSSTPPNVGVINMNGSGTLLRVNNNLAMGYTTNAADAAAANSYGSLNVNGGTVLANNITVGAASTIASMQIALNNATLIVSNTMATNAAGLAVFSMTNSTLGLTASTILSPDALVKTLYLAGPTNNFQLTVPVMGTYPQVVPLLKYTTLVGTFNVGMSNVPASAPNSYVTNVTGSPNIIELVLPTDPRPVFTAQPSPYSGMPGDNIPTNFTVQISAGSVTPINYQWYYVTNGVTNLLNNGAGPSGSSTLSGVNTTNLQFLNAQTNDSGNYFVVAANAYGTNSSSLAALIISTNPIPPTVTGPTALTVTNGVTGVIGDSVSGSPVPALFWYYNGSLLANGPGPSGSSTISGVGTATLTIANPQYPGDQGAYSLIASNSAGLATNTTVLSVIVPPQITSQPASLVVTNTQAASFTVAATGVPSPAFQWYFNNVQIGGATSPTYNLASVSPANTGNYYCTITNQAGSTNTATVTLTVNSTMAATTMVPVNSSTGICYDTPLYLTFNTTPVLRNSGSIKVYDVTNPSTPVVTINLGLNTAGGVQQRANFQGDSQGFNYYPVIINGNTAAIYLYAASTGVLTSNQTYYVTIDDGVFADSTGAYFAGVSGSSTWQFTTKTGGPADPNNLFVAQDYSGDFATVQGAIDSVASANTTPHVVHIKNGFYEEIVDVSGKNNIVLFGQNRTSTIVGYPNNASIATGGGSTHSRMSFKVNANDISLADFTLTNMTPQDASQAEALMIESGAARLIVFDCNVDSYQDTILANISTSKAYFKNDLIQGDVDFIWGGGNLFFTNCEIRYLIRAANAAALGPNPSPSASDINSNGFSFISCALTSLPGANSNDTVGRTRSITNGNTALINCFVTTNIGGWFSDAAPVTEYRNWYHGCTNDLGSPVTLSNGIALSGSDPNLTLASSCIQWLYGWNPSLAPLVTNQPVNVSVSFGQPATLGVGAIAVPDLTNSSSYQWLLNGVPINGANGSSYAIASAVRTNGGNYSVIINNGLGGSVTSSVAVLTYIDTPPVAPSFSIGALLGITETVPIVGGLNTPTDVDGDALTITSVSPGANGTVTTDGANAIYTATGGASDSFTYTVSDGYGGTATGAVSVTINSNVAGYDLLSAAPTGSGTNVISFLGIPVYNYALDLATNLAPPVNWVPQTTNQANISGVQTYTNISTQPQSFYRTRQTH